VPARRSAGLLVYRRATGDGLQVLLGHMGGPYWAGKDDRAWSIPKGEVEDGEPLLDAARREFAEELGLPAPDGDLVDLGTVRQPSGKIVTVWAVRGDLDVTSITAGTFTMEWPRGSGVLQEFPELDRAEWFGLPVAAVKLVKGQLPFLERLATALTDRPG